MNKVEEVARAIVRRRHIKCCRGAALDDVCALPLREDDLESARAAIEAMREPTAEMRASGITAFLKAQKDGSSPARSGWIAMIDAALDETE